MNQPSTDARITRRDLLISLAAMAAVSASAKGWHPSTLAPSIPVNDAPLDGSDSTCAKNFVLYL